METFNNKKIVVYNQKGGVGKTSISKEISTVISTNLVDCDVYGALEDSLSLQEERGHQVTNVVKVDVINGDIPDIPGVYDLGGYENAVFDDLLTNADLVIIPSMTSFEDKIGTVESYSFVKEELGNDNILIIVNGFDNKEQFKRVSEDIAQEIGIDVDDIFPIPRSNAFYTASDKGCTISQLKTESSFNKRIYKKITGVFSDLIENMKDYM
jgi:cellulose biosynthesis protein BcsQ